MASRLPDGSIQMANGRIIYGNSVILAEDICELVPILCPPSPGGASVFPGLFRGGSGGGGGFGGFGGPGGGGGGAGSPGPQGIPGPINRIQDEGINLPLRNVLNFIGSGVSAVDNPGAGATDVTINDLYTANRIVATNPAEGTDTTIAAAVANLPAGGTIWIKDPVVITSSIVIGDVDLEFRFDKAATVDATGLGVNPLFKCLSGLTQLRYVFITNITAIGGNVAGQSFIELNDINSLCKPTVIQPKITGFRIIVDVKAGDVTFTEPVVVRFASGRISSPDNSSPFLKTAAAAGSYAFGTSIFFDGTFLVPENAPSANAWTINFDGDIITYGALWLNIAADSVVDGLEASGPMAIQIRTGTLEVLGGSYWANPQIDCFLTGNLKISVTMDIRVMSGFGTLILNAPRIKVEWVECNPFFTMAIAVDILAPAIGCKVSGTFRDNTTAVIRTASTGGSFSGTFVSTGANKTILELAGADFNISTGSTGLNSGGGVTQVGAGSKYAYLLAGDPNIG